MEKLGVRKGMLKDMVPDGKGRVRLDYEIPTRGLIGFRSDFLTTTSGSGLMYHVFDRYAPRVGGTIGRRAKGVLISKHTGTAVRLRFVQSARARKNDGWSPRSGL